MALIMLGAGAIAFSFVVEGDAVGIARLAAGVPIVTALIIALATGSRREPTRGPGDRTADRNNVRPAR